MPVTVAERHTEVPNPVITTGAATPTPTARHERRFGHDTPARAWTTTGIFSPDHAVPLDAAADGPLEEQPEEAATTAAPASKQDAMRRLRAAPATLRRRDGRVPITVVIVSDPAAYFSWVFSTVEVVGAAFHF